MHIVQSDKYEDNMMQSLDLNTTEHLWNNMEPHVQAAPYSKMKGCILAQRSSILKVLLIKHEFNKKCCWQNIFWESYV